MRNLSELEKEINVTFRDITLLESALTHRSYLNENRKIKVENYERLEFLGDAVLELAVSEFLFDKFGDKEEGELTALRASLVNTQSIGMAANSLRLNDFLRLSKGEAKDTGRARQIILADSFEAIIGAVYKDQGFEVAKTMIAKTLFHKLENIISERTWQDAKSKFQELSQGKLSITPTYKIISETGPDHDKVFLCVAMLGEERIAEGRGRSKQEAEQEAAAKALLVKGW